MGVRTFAQRAHWDSKGLTGAQKAQRGSPKLKRSHLAHWDSSRPTSNSWSSPKISWSTEKKSPRNVWDSIGLGSQVLKRAHQDSKELTRALSKLSQRLTGAHRGSKGLSEAQSSSLKQSERRLVYTLTGNDRMDIELASRIQLVKIWKELRWK